MRRTDSGRVRRLPTRQATLQPRDLVPQACEQSIQLSSRLPGKLQSFHETLNRLRQRQQLARFDLRDRRLSHAGPRRQILPSEAGILAQSSEQLTQCPQAVPTIVHTQRSTTRKTIGSDADPDHCRIVLMGYQGRRSAPPRGPPPLGCRACGLGAGPGRRTARAAPCRSPAASIANEVEFECGVFPADGGQARHVRQDVTFAGGLCEPSEVVQLCEKLRDLLTGKDQVAIWIYALQHGHHAAPACPIHQAHEDVVPVTHNRANRNEPSSPRARSSTIHSHQDRIDSHFAPHRVFSKEQPPAGALRLRDDRLGCVRLRCP